MKILQDIMVTLDSLVKSKKRVKFEECTAEDGTSAWKIFMNGQTLDEYLFYQKPSKYDSWECGENTYKVAVHELQYTRGGPDMQVADVGVKIMGFVGEKAHRFDASMTTQGILGCDAPEMDFEISGAREAFETDHDYKCFCEEVETHLTENYDFTIRYE